MDNLLFSGRSLWTMLHGIVLGGGALMALAAALFSLHVSNAAAGTDPAAENLARSLGRLLVGTAALLWLTVLAGTYVIFPPYRATPPEGITDLARYPRSLLQSDPSVQWLHSFAMEIKEHVPWIAAMLATAVAFVAARYRSLLLSDVMLRRMASTILEVAFALSAAAALLGVLVNKVAPLE